MRTSGWDIIKSLLNARKGILNLGTVATTGHSLGTGDVLIGGDLEVDGVLYLDSDMVMQDDCAIQLGGGALKLIWETADANANELILALPNGGAVDVPVFVIGDQGIVNNNLGWFNGQTIPRVAMVAADEGGYFSFGVDNSDILDILATTAPVVEVDETKFSHKLQCVINGTTYYIMLTQT